MWIVATVLLGSFLLPSAPLGDVLFEDDFEDGSLYAWSSSEPSPAWWRRQVVESCPEYALRFFEDDLWGCCCCTSSAEIRRYWTRRPGQASGHACNLLTGDEYLRPIFFSDFEFHWLGWSVLVNPGGS